MTAAERVAAVRRKIERARQHVEDLHIRWKAFGDTEPYSVGARYDPQTTRYSYYLIGAADVPVELATIAGDALQNLRSALDHLAYQLVLVGTGQPGPFTHVYFPIADDAGKYEDTKKRRTFGMRPEAVAAIDALKPYRTGNEVLWRLHALNNIDKHRLLITVFARQAVDIGEVMRRELGALQPAVAALKMPPLFLTAAQVEPLRVGEDLYIDKPGAPMMPHLSFRFQLALAEPGVVSAPLVPLLQEMTATVDKVVGDFEPLLQ